MRIHPLAVAALLIALAAPLPAADKLRLNEATQAQLVALGLTESQAIQVLSYRKENGDFLQVEELLAVPQMSHAAFEKLREKVTVDE
jgi:competence ComEA-like helix-hairpin-helix protein